MPEAGNDFLSTVKAASIEELIDTINEFSPDLRKIPQQGLSTEMSQALQAFTQPILSETSREELERRVFALAALDHPIATCIRGYPPLIPGTPENPTSVFNELNSLLGEL